MIRFRIVVLGIVVALALVANGQSACANDDDVREIRRQVTSLLAERGGRLVVSQAAGDEPVVALELAGSQVADGDLPLLARMPGLVRLDLSTTWMSSRR